MLITQRVFVRQDVHDIYEDLAYMYTYSNDVRYQNILRAPASPPGFPGLVCPIHKRVHEWRLVDLERAAETNATLEVLKDWCDGWLEPILNNLPHGYYFNPEDVF